MTALKILLCPLLTLSWRSSPYYRNQSTDLLCKPMDWFLYDRDLRHERVKYIVPHTEDISSAYDKIWNLEIVMSFKVTTKKTNFKEVWNFIFKARNKSILNDVALYPYCWLWTSKCRLRNCNSLSQNIKFRCVLRTFMLSKNFQLFKKTDFPTNFNQEIRKVPCQNTHARLLCLCSSRFSKLLYYQLLTLLYDTST